MLRRASCGHCSAFLPLDCGFFTFRLPAHTVRCHKCGNTNQTTPAYRSTWLGQQLFRAATYFFTALGFAFAFFTPDRFFLAAGCGALFGSMFGMLVGVLLGVFVAPLIRIGLDMHHEMRRLELPPEEEGQAPSALFASPPPLPRTADWKPSQHSTTRS